MSLIWKYLSNTALLAGLATSIICAANSPDDVLIETSQVKILRSDYDAAIDRIPADLRDDFATSGRRIAQLLYNVLIHKTLAKKAREQGLEPAAGSPLDTPSDVERALAASEIRVIEEAAGKEFDAKQDVFLVTAKENYLIDSDKYERPEQVKLSLIVIKNEGHGKEAALALVRGIREKLGSGADFNTLAKEVSEDKDSAVNGGQLDWLSAKQLESPVAEEAFALKLQVISEPIEVTQGYVLIRVDAKRAAGKIPFNEAKSTILAGLRQQYVNNARERQLDAIRNDPTLKSNQAELDALVVHMDPERMKPTIPAGGGAYQPPAAAK